MPPPLPDTTRGALLEAAVRQFEEAGLPNARREAEWLLGDALETGRAQIYGHPEREVASAARQLFAKRVQRRLAGEPLQYVLGYAEFYGLRLSVTPSVLIPRPETEQLVELALERIASVRAPKAFDAGTGSGCIALALASERPDAVVSACDLSAEALAVARANAERLGLRVQFEQTDLRSAARSAFPSDLDLLISNPPYIPDAERETLPGEVRDHEPSAALFSGTDPLTFYRILADLASGLLRTGGWVALEVHERHAQAVHGLFSSSHFARAEVLHDLAKKPRFVVARLREDVA